MLKKLIDHLQKINDNMAKDMLIMLDMQYQANQKKQQALENTKKLRRYTNV